MNGSDCETEEGRLPTVAGTTEEMTPSSSAPVEVLKTGDPEDNTEVDDGCDESNSCTCSETSDDSEEAEQGQEEEGASPGPTVVVSPVPLRSILTASAEPRELYIRDNKPRYWGRSMPPPDLESLRAASIGGSTKSVSSTSATGDELDDPSVTSKKMLSFGDIRIRKYDQTVGDNPCVSFGAPITLDWTYQEVEPIPVEDYEDRRGGPPRTARQMQMNYYRR